MDDILIYSDTLEEHAKHIETIMQRLRENCVFIKPSKCVIAVPELLFCGMIINKDGVKIAESQIESIGKYPQITSLKDVLSFMGIIRFYADFIKDLADLAVPLYDLTRKNTLFIWTVDHQSRFIVIQNQIINSTTLHFFDPKLPTMVYTTMAELLDFKAFQFHIALPPSLVY